MIELLPEIDLVEDDPFNSSPKDPGLMGPQVLQRFRDGENIPAFRGKTPLVSLSQYHRVSITIRMQGNALWFGRRSFEKVQLSDGDSPSQATLLLASSLEGISRRPFVERKKPWARQEIFPTMIECLKWLNYVEKAVVLNLRRCNGWTRSAHLKLCCKSRHGHCFSLCRSDVSKRFQKLIWSANPTAFLPVQVELPLGATEDRICGTIDVEKALQEGVKAYEPGLLVSSTQDLISLERGHETIQPYSAA